MHALRCSQNVIHNPVSRFDAVLCDELPYLIKISKRPRVKSNPAHGRRAALFLRK